MRALLDVNVLVALAWPNHLDHSLARDWFAGASRRGWATCPLTESAFVRISLNPRLHRSPPGFDACLEVLRRLRRLGRHEFLSDDEAPAESERFAACRVVAYRQVTDAHLLALALRHEARLATLDRGTFDLVPDGIEAEGAIELIRRP